MTDLDQNDIRFLLAALDSPVRLLYDPSRNLELEGDFVLMADGQPLSAHPTLGDAVRAIVAALKNR